MQQKKFSQMRGMPVRTTSGTELGTVRDAVLDIDTGRIIQFLVKTRLIGGTELLVPMDAIVEIRDEVLVVKDGLIPAAVGALA